MLDTLGGGEQNQGADRPAWIGVLARAPLDLLESALAPYCLDAPEWLRAPETGLMMVQGRAGATGERFNLGEVTVTRCTLRLRRAPTDQPLVGVAYVLGRSHRQARLAATADALLKDPSLHQNLTTVLLDPVRQHLAQQQAKRAARAASTKVEFFTLARESGAASAEEEGE